MKKNTSTGMIVSAVIVFFMAMPLFAQQPPGIAFIDELSRKSEATLGDAVQFFVMIKGERSRGFGPDLQILQTADLLDDREYTADETLKRGEVAFIAARLLELDDSLLYNIFENRRYAVTACRAAGIMHGFSGENATVSGGELIDVMTLVSEKMEGGI